jgi:hypothetical protein
MAELCLIFVMSEVCALISVAPHLEPGLVFEMKYLRFVQLSVNISP